MHSGTAEPISTTDTGPGTTSGTTSRATTGTVPGHDPRVGWSTVEDIAIPVLRARRDGILPNVAAALSVRGTTLTSTAARGEQPPALHPLVQDFLSTLTSAQRDRFTGRCAEAILISRHLTATDAERTEKSKRARRKPMTMSEARKALKNAKLTTRRIREDGDPLHGGFARPCRACAALTAHFGVHVVAPPDRGETPSRAADRTEATR
ncbi:YwqJ-related putative deaminase [Streptomyces beihaiensis]|uniref:YwqJ-related putative deaminase n=1 Tax=Streptomyces beihaiensis TaxID=2984495 RepID=A0ABT3U3J5_9ACTN|nr:YwqJ-related putative deaminase [Streptomyces beihaiensis]MCX3063902.1 YwqJ-related putative deaminase [Streptomyces beihaiensis]